MMKDLINVLLVDDHPIFRNTFKLLLTYIGNIIVMGDASNGQEFLNLIQIKKPDMVLMDIKMPVMNGVEATSKALKQYPDMKIIALTMFEDKEYVTQMLDAGARGFLLKTIEKDELENAITAVYQNRIYYSESLKDVIS